MAYRSGVVAPVEGGGAREEQRLHVVGVDGERGGARASWRLRRGFAATYVGEQAGLDLAARFFMLVRGQRSGAQVEVELAQLIAVYGDIDGIAGRARTRAATQQRRHDEQQGAGDEHRADEYERSHRRSASLCARSSAARLRSEAVISASCPGRRRRTRRRRTTNPAASSSS